ncbi:Na+/H+ antiporter subunit E [Amylibacter sp. SFDW26]|uniref:Na+/H+ antiporter subunit E n=1 Tax=Amylibacter sp. SFDW26 TaxID=2652722 RepID=UPI00126262AC|nr:Na+/H+ antiporter subunit E [Amylibacter sp. SFDW26]KAB7613835.1 Na+/H+ antiporter subunit E [Amylibacter sp. SFDW26]
MLRTLLTALILFVLWLLMSGIYKPMIIGFGIISAMISVYVVRRMDNAADADRLEVNLGVFATIAYWAWLMVEIAKANWAVTKLILSPSMPINRHMFRIPYTQKTDLGQAIFANSITLTPGTISVEVEEGEFLIHAVGYSEDDLDALADMDRRVTAIEKDSI